MKYLHIFFPLFDHLYIYQLFEYDSKRFLKWFSNSIFERNLQKKHALELTTKAKVLLILSLGLIGASSFILSIFSLSIILFLINFIFLSYFSPFFLVGANLLLFPVDSFIKGRIISSAKIKRKGLKNIKVVAIVGSFAKTSTKNMLTALLWKDFYVVKTPKSYNTQISVARCLLNDVKESTDIFIAEMDAYSPGEISKLCDIAHPDFGVITSIASQHLERFNSMEELAKTQFELSKSLEGRGIFFVNTKDLWIKELEKKYPGKKIYYGDAKSKNYITNIKQTPVGLKFTLCLSGLSTVIELPLFGEHNAYNFLAAATIAHQLGLALLKIKERATWILPTEHRLEVKQMQGYTLIDNTYNTNVSSFRSSLKLLESFKSSQKIIITPGILEIGPESLEEHITLAKQSAKIVDIFVVVGELNKKGLLKGLGEAKFPTGKTLMAKTTKEALSLIPQIVKLNGVVLLENDLPDQYS